MKAVVAAFNQEKALVGTFSVLTNLRMELFQALERRVSQLSYPELDLRDRSGIRARAGWPSSYPLPAAARMVYKCKDTFNDCNSVKLWPGCDHVPRHRH